MKGKVDLGRIWNQNIKTDETLLSVSLNELTFQSAHRLVKNIDKFFRFVICYFVSNFGSSLEISSRRSVD